MTDVTSRAVSLVEKMIDKGLLTDPRQVAQEIENIRNVLMAGTAVQSAAAPVAHTPAPPPAPAPLPVALPQAVKVEQETTRTAPVAPPALSLPLNKASESQDQAPRKRGRPATAKTIEKLARLNEEKNNAVDKTRLQRHPAGRIMTAVEMGQKPAVPLSESIKNDYIICLEDGESRNMLKRHLRSTYGMSPEEYREKWGLPEEYPMVAPSYSLAKRKYAERIGFGTTTRGNAKAGAAANADSEMENA